MSRANACTLPPNAPTRRINAVAQAVDNIDEVRKYLRILDRIFDLEAFLKYDGSPESVADYYTRSRWVYDLLHSRAGAMHMALSYDGRFRSAGFREQPRLVDAEISRRKDVRSVLEVGCGKGYNTAILARKQTEVDFTAVDITPAHARVAAERTRRQRNVDVRVGDFEALKFDSGRFDLAFAIECLCHARSLPQVLEEVRRVVRPGAAFVVVDGFREPEFDRMPPALQVASQLVELSMAVERFWQIDVFTQTAAACGWRVAEVRDLGAAIRPNLRRLQRIARWYFQSEHAAAFLTRHLPPYLVRHAITGLLGAATLDGGTQGYYALVLEAVD